jgi:hypothetical protein
MSLNNTRRGFLATAGAIIPAIPLASLSPQTRARIRVTDVRLVNLRVVKEIGSMEPAWNLGSQFSFRIGGGSILEIRTDQGLTGIAHPCPADSIPAIREYLVGKDPFEAESHISNLARA